MEIVFVRHGQPEWGRDGVAVDEPGLTPFGRSQATRVAGRLAGERFDEAYVSPLQRARETAEPIGERLGISFRIQPWVAELRMPPLAGTPLGEVEKFFDGVRARDLDHWWDGVPGGESFRHFQARVAGGIEALLAGGHDTRLHGESAQRLWSVPDPDRRLLIVAHGGSIAVSLAYLLGLEQVPWAVERLSIGFAGIARVHTRPIGGGAVWSLTSFNDRSHVAGPDDVEW